MGQRGGHFAPLNVQTLLFTETQRLHLGTIVEYEHVFDQPFETAAAAYEFIEEDSINLIRQYVNHFGNVRLLFTTYFRLVSIPDNSVRLVNLRTPWLRITHPNFIHNMLEFAFQYVIQSLNLYNQGSSSHMLDWIINVRFQFAELTAIAPMSYIPTSKSLSSKGAAILNIKTYQNNCTELSIYAALYRESKIRLPDCPDLTFDKMNANEMQIRRLWANPLSYKKIRQEVKTKKLIDFSGISTPIKLKELSNFEEKNKIGICVYTSS